MELARTGHAYLLRVVACAQTQPTEERVWERDFAKKVGRDLKCGWSWVIQIFQLMSCCELWLTFPLSRGMCSSFL